jgi:hypothetical protein
MESEFLDTELEKLANLFTCHARENRSLHGLFTEQFKNEKNFRKLIRKRKHSYALMLVLQLFNIVIERINKGGALNGSGSVENIGK